LGRLRTVVQAQSRLLAYTSEVGEAFRPVVNQTLVTGAYAVSWLYILGDVGYEGYKMQKHGGETQDIARTVVERGIFQSLASMIFPAVTVHTIVDQSSKLVKSWPTSSLKRFGPSALGLSTIPILPVLFDHPTEYVIENLFNAVWPLTPKGVQARKEEHGKQH
jgi:mitochondrial fission process protein 1